MQSVIVDIVVTADEFVKQYRHPGAIIITRSRDGRNVRFPANILQRFVTHVGISGTFSIRFDQQGKFKAVEKLSN